MTGSLRVSDSAALNQIAVGHRRASFGDRRPGTPKEGKTWTQGLTLYTRKGGVSTS